MPGLQQARIDMQAAFWQEWQARAMAALSYVPLTRWEGREDSTPANPDEVWVRVSIRHASGTQTTLAEPGARRFRHRGTFIVQVFTPIARGADYGALAAQAALQSLQGKSTPDIWYSNARVNESTPDEPWLVWLVRADFEYDEVA